MTTQPTSDLVRRLYQLANTSLGAVPPDALNLLLRSIGTSAVDAFGLSPGLAREWQLAIQQYVAVNGPFTKAQALYVGAHPPPALWPYYCGRCLFWQEPDRCTVVKGDIYFAGWCALFMPQNGPNGRPAMPFLAYQWYIQDVMRLVADLPKFLQAPLGREV